MSALLLLFRLQTKALVRRLFRGAKTVRGAMLTVFSVGFFGSMFLPNIFLSLMERERTASQFIEYLPYMLLAYFFVSLISTQGDQGNLFFAL